MENDDIKKEFEAFEDPKNAISPPSELSDQVKNKILRLLNPSPWMILLKLSGLHFVVAAGTLVVCPQFGVGYGSAKGLYVFFQSFGEYGCMAACGAFFMGVSALAALAVLTFDEKRILRKYSYAYFGGLSLVSLALFSGLGGEVVLSLGLAWFIGAVGAAMAVIRVGQMRSSHS